MSAPGEPTLFANGLALTAFNDGAVGLTLDGIAMHLNRRQAEALKIFAIAYVEPKTVKTLADEARDIVYGDREQTHGEPAKNLQAIAHIWSALTDSKITSEHVCLMLIGLKLARAANQPRHRDHWVDIVGYTLLAERCKFIAPAKE